MPLWETKCIQEGDRNFEVDHLVEVEDTRDGTPFGTAKSGYVSVKQAVNLWRDLCCGVRVQTHRLLMVATMRT